jgi:multiple sugar transport system substrate-binding protein
MRNRCFVLSVVVMLLVGACGGGATSAPSVATSPEATTGTSSEPSQAAFDPSTISGEVTLGLWESSPAEGKALTDALAAFATKYPNIKVNQTTIKGDYRAQMVTAFGAKDEPDIFYVNAEYAPEWMDPANGFLLPLDDYIAKQGFDTSKFFPGYADIFKGTDGKTYGLPKDGNTIAMAVNTDLVPTAPTTMDDLVTMATSLKSNSSIKAPMCLSPSLDRGLAFLYAQGGSLTNADNTAGAIDSAESKTALQWYLDLFKNGLGKSPSDLGDGWCGEALGKGDVAFAFEGGWLLGYMKDTFPAVKWAFNEMPTGSTGTKSTITFTAAYGIGPDSKNKDAAWVVMQYLTGPEGMAAWTKGGIAVPSRSDVPVPPGFEVIVKGADYAKPGSGFFKGFADVQKAFNDAFLAEVTNKTYSADTVIAATKTKLDAALAQ